MADATNPTRDGIFSQSSFAIVRSESLSDAVAAEVRLVSHTSARS